MTIETRPFDPAAYLDSPEAMLAYLEGAFADGDAGEVSDGTPRNWCGTPARESWRISTRPRLRPRWEGWR